MRTVKIEKQVPIVGSYDVVVCGGGPAGFIAAITAAREGARTALIERYGFLGGMATAGYVSPISEFKFDDAIVIGGVPWEFIERLEAMDGAFVERDIGNIAFDPERYKLCAQRMVLEAGVTLYTNSYLTGCVCENNIIRQVIIENKNGAEAIESKVFIDATGDADLAYAAHVPMQPMNGESLQPLSTYFILQGVDTSSPMIQEAMHHNKQGKNCHCLPVREKLLEMMKTQEMPNFGGPWFCTLLRDGAVTVNMTRTTANACDNRDYARAECQLREDVFTLADLLRQTFPEFKNARVASVAVQAGVRETRRIVGVHTVTGEEYVNAVHYEDSVSHGIHPIDIHSSKQSEQYTYFLKQPAYVPYRALIAPDYPNLFVAGRCLSADRQAFASLRVQGSCMDMGQAAGAAAAQCAASGNPVQKADVPELIAHLKALGARL